MNSEYVPDFARYLLEETIGVVQHSTIAIKQYVKDHKVCLAKLEERLKRWQYLARCSRTDPMTERKRKELQALQGKYGVKPKPMDMNIATGTFGI
jgi:hypothetical protein